MFSIASDVCNLCREHHPWSSEHCAELKTSIENIPKNPTHSSPDLMTSLPKPDPTWIDNPTVKSNTKKIPSSAPSARRKKITCGACGQKGHMRTNRLCHKHHNSRAASVEKVEEIRCNCCGRWGHKKTNRKCPRYLSKHSHITKTNYTSPVPVYKKPRKSSSTTITTTTTTTHESSDSFLSDSEEDIRSVPIECKEDEIDIFGDAERRMENAEETLKKTEEMLKKIKARHLQKLISPPLSELSLDVGRDTILLDQDTDNDSSTYKDLVMAHRAAERRLKFNFETAPLTMLENFKYNIPFPHADIPSDTGHSPTQQHTRQVWESPYRSTRSTLRPLFHGGEGFTLGNTSNRNRFLNWSRRNERKHEDTPFAVGTNASTKTKNNTSTSHTSEKSDQVLDDMECVVCLTNRKNRFLIPCGHVCMCAECCDGLIARSIAPYTPCAKCPLCRTDIEGVSEAFI
ncbi:MAG: RING finger protein [Promethearchaeota archaeon]